jgi:hypothetical protein
MLGFALVDFHRRKFCTKISTGFVEIFDGFWDGNLTSEAAERPFHEAESALSSSLDPQRHRPFLSASSPKSGESITISPLSCSPRTACRSGVRRQARRFPPTVHNQQSSCRDTASL